jgi:hypothetical protein
LQAVADTLSVFQDDNPVGVGRSLPSRHQVSGFNPVFVSLSDELWQGLNVTTWADAVPARGLW